MVGVLSRLPVVSSIGGHLSQRPASILPGAHHQLTTVLQGASKKMIHSDFSLKSVPGVRFYFFRGVLEPKFCARTI